MTEDSNGQQPEQPGERWGHDQWGRHFAACVNEAIASRPACRRFRFFGTHFDLPSPRCFRWAAERIPHQSRQPLLRCSTSCIHAVDRSGSRRLRAPELELPRFLPEQKPNSEAGPKGGCQGWQPSTLVGCHRIRPCVRSRGAQMHDLDKADQPSVARPMGSLLKPGAGDDSHSESRAQGQPHCRLVVASVIISQRHARRRTCRRRVSGNSRHARVCVRQP